MDCHSGQQDGALPSTADSSSKIKKIAPTGPERAKTDLGIVRTFARAAMFSAKMTSAICLMTLLTHAAGQKACFQDYALASSLAGCVSPFDSNVVLADSAVK